MKIYIVIVFILILGGCGAIKEQDVQRNEKKYEKQKQQNTKIEEDNSIANNPFEYEKPSYDLKSKIKNPKIFLVSMEGTELYSKNKSKIFGCNDKLIEFDLKEEMAPIEILNKLFNTIEIDNKLYYNVFNNSKNIKVNSLEVNKNGELEIMLSGEISSGGMCDDPRFRAQITKTLDIMGLPIENYHIYLNGKDLFEILSNMNDLKD